MFTESEVLEILNCINCKGSESKLNKDTKNVLERIIKEYAENEEIQQCANDLLNFYF